MIRLCVVPIRSVIILVVNKSDEHSLFPYHYFEVTWSTDQQHHLLQQINVNVYLLHFRLSVSAISPQSRSSPLSGKGFMHVLLLVWFSWRGHSVHSVHCVQYPLTNDKWCEHVRAVLGNINCCRVDNCLRVHTTLFCLTLSFTVQLGY